MDSSERRLWRNLILCTMLAAGARPAFASDQQPAGSPLAPADATLPSGMQDADAHEKARALFERGQVQYTLGEYDDAIALFREAYVLTAAPILLFNLAQAHRLRGDAGQATELYRHFLRLAPDAPLAVEARAHIRALTAALTPTPAPVPGACPQTPERPQVAERSSRPSPDDPSPASTRMVASRALLIAGLGVAAGAGGLALWNNHRHDKWGDEDAQLQNGPPPGIDPAPWIARQDANDALLRSIWRVDTVTWVLAGVSAASVLSAAILGQLPDHRIQLGLQPDGVQMAWLTSWP